MDCKNEIYAKNWVKNTWTAKKSTPEKSQRSNSLKGQRLKLREEVNYRMMQVNDVSNKG